MSGSRETTSRSRSAARHRRHLLGGSILLHQRLGPLEQTVRMHRARTVIVFSTLPRGRHRLEPLDVALTDPLGLARVEQQVDEAASVLIRPRIPTLTSIFSAHGARDAGAARSRLRRPTGFEIHAVRDYTPGEPLRAVHWPSTARRGRLMVKELDDAPRDDLAIVLDQDPDGVAGPVGQSSFDAAVRAAGALALAHVLWNRRVVLVGTAAETEDVRIRAAGHDWELALDALATVEPVEGARVDRALRSPSAAITRAREIVVVTGRPDRAVEPLLELRRGGRSVSLVIMASETYAGRPATHSSRPRCARRRRACSVGRRHCRDPDRRGSGRAQRGSGQWLASIGGFGRRLLAASVPVVAVAYAWASLESGPSGACVRGRRGAGGAGRAAVEAGRPCRRRRRDARWVDPRRRRAQRRGGPGGRRPGSA